MLIKYVYIYIIQLDEFNDSISSHDFKTVSNCF